MTPVGAGVCCLTDRSPQLPKGPWFAVASAPCLTPVVPWFATWSVASRDTGLGMQTNGQSQTSTGSQPGGHLHEQMLMIELIEHETRHPEASRSTLDSTDPQLLPRS